jgi:hypothetical protein
VYLLLNDLENEGLVRMVEIGETGDEIECAYRLNL